MKKFLFALILSFVVLGTQLVHASNRSCSHLYVGKAVTYHYVVKYGDFFLGYKPYDEYADAKVIGIGNGVASIEITRIYSGHSQAPRVGDIKEVACSSL